ncbi:MAG: FkbM family methyltransferase [Chlamydiales bacterium]|nr:FkbM family methyltransferase [Chlamydiales bacterium]
MISPRHPEMMAYISEFPLFSEYHVKKVPCSGYEGYFYIDAIEDHIKNSLEEGYAWETHISKLISKCARRGSVVLDVGAHIGIHALTMAHCVGELGRVHAFEPQPKIFRELFLNMKLNEMENVSCHWAAVGDTTGTIETHPFTPGNEGGTSLIASNLTGGNWTYRAAGGTGVFVDLITIDSLHLNDVSLMKIDVEGMENAVIDGARETILRNRPMIILEIMGGSTLKTAPAEIADQIEFSKRKVVDLGYNLTHIFGWDYLAIPK